MLLGVYSMRTRVIIERALRSDTMMNMRYAACAGELWQKLKERYLKKSPADRCAAIYKVTKYQKKPGMGLEESLEEIERLSSELTEQTSLTLDDEILRYIWMDGLPSEYRGAIQNVVSSGVHDRSDMLVRLSAVKEPMTGVPDRASQANLKCFVCSKPGHKARDCYRRPKGEEMQRDASVAKEKA